MSDADRTELVEDLSGLDAEAWLKDFVANCLHRFPPEQVGKLPRITCRDCSQSKGTKCCDKHQKQDCRVCGNWITTQHMHLDYVGHAELTARLLELDPVWNWEPVAFDERGLPAISNRDGQCVMWIQLTVRGITRLGVGTCSASKDEVHKELVGDALRNAAIRFGIALDLWAKSDLAGSFDADDGPAADASPRGERSAVQAGSDGPDLQARFDALQGPAMLRAKKDLAKAGLWPLAKVGGDRSAEATSIITGHATSAAQRPAEGSQGEGRADTAGSGGSPENGSAGVSGDPVPLREVLINQHFLKLKGQFAKDAKKSLEAAGFWPVTDVAEPDLQDAIEVVSMFTEAQGKAS